MSPLYKVYRVKMKMTMTMMIEGTKDLRGQVLVLRDGYAP